MIVSITIATTRVEFTNAAITCNCTRLASGISHNTPYLTIARTSSISCGTPYHVSSNSLSYKTLRNKSSSNHQTNCHQWCDCPLSLLHLLLRKLFQLHRHIRLCVEYFAFKCLIVHAACCCGGGDYSQNHHGCGDLFLHKNSFAKKGWKNQSLLKTYAVCPISAQNLSDPKY